MLAKKLYGDGGLINESFPADKIYNKKFDIIIALSCLDKICKKEVFLECVKKNLKKNSILYIAVRNQAFILNRLKPIFNTKKQVIPDLDLMEYKKLFTKKEFKIISDGKFFRPWITGFNLIGVKNLIYKVISKILPKNISYMLYFKLRID